MAGGNIGESGRVDTRGCSSQSSILSDDDALVVIVASPFSLIVRGTFDEDPGDGNDVCTIPMGSGNGLVLDDVHGTAFGPSPLVSGVTAASVAVIFAASCRLPPREISTVLLARDTAMHALHSSCGGKPSPVMTTTASTVAACSHRRPMHR